MRILCEQLPALESLAGTDIRAAVELMIDTGRRPDEICGLPLECLDRDPDGSPILVYGNRKAYRNGRRLSVSAATAAELQAARAANGEMMTRINTARRAPG